MNNSTDSAVEKLRSEIKKKRECMDRLQAELARDEQRLKTLEKLAKPKGSLREDRSLGLLQRALRKKAEEGANATKVNLTQAPSAAARRKAFSSWRVRKAASAAGALGENVSCPLILGTSGLDREPLTAPPACSEDKDEVDKDMAEVVQKKLTAHAECAYSALLSAPEAAKPAPLPFCLDGFEVEALLEGAMLAPLLLCFVERLLGPLRRRPRSAKELIDETSLEGGAVELVLRACVALGIVKRDPVECVFQPADNLVLSEMECALGSRAPLRVFLVWLHTEAAWPFQIPSEEASRCLHAWEQHRSLRANLKSARLRALLDGAVAAPLLVSAAHAVARQDAAGQGGPVTLKWKNVKSADVVTLTAFLQEAMGFGTVNERDDEFIFSDEGLRRLEVACSRCFELSSCLPLLHLLVEEANGKPCGTPGAVDKVQSSLCELGRRSLDRQLLPALLELVGGAFREEDGAARPDCLVVATSSSELPQTLFQEAIKYAGRCGGREARPVTVIAVCSDAISASGVTRALQRARVPHKVLCCDVDDLLQLQFSLADMQVDTSTVLHVRPCPRGSWLFVAPSQAGSRERDAFSLFAEQQLQGLLRLDERGRRIAPHELLSALVAHFERWGTVVWFCKGLCTFQQCAPGCQDPLDPHADPAALVAQALPGQHAVPAPALALAAAMAGLLPSRAQDAYARRDIDGHCRLLGQRFARKDFRIRLAEREDLPRLLELDEACGMEGQRASREVLLRRLETSPATNLVCTAGSKITAVLYMQRIMTRAALEGRTIADVSGIHSPTGKLLHFIAIAADPKHSGAGLELRNFALHWARLEPSLQGVVAVTLARGFARQGGASMKDYVRQHVQGELFDPLIGFHTSAGARVGELVHGFRPDDKDNKGIGVMVEYSLGDGDFVLGEGGCVGDPEEVGPSILEELPEQGAKVAGMPMTHRILAKLDELGYHLREDEAWRDLLDFGLDSSDLEALRTVLCAELGVHLPMAQLVDCLTIELLSKELERLVAQKSAGAAPEASAAPAGEEAKDDDVWECMSLKEVEATHTELITYFSQPELKDLFSEKASLCRSSLPGNEQCVRNTQNAIKFGFIVDNILRDGYGHVFLRLGLIRDAERRTVDEAQGKLWQAALRYWRLGRVRELRQHLLQLTGLRTGRAEEPAEEESKEECADEQRGNSAAAGPTSGMSLKA